MGTTAHIGVTQGCRHRTTRLEEAKSISAGSPEPAALSLPTPQWLLFPFDFEYSYFSSTLPRA